MGPTLVAVRLLGGGLMRALVTGGAGFIGHHLVRALVERGDDVVVLDDLSTGRLERLASLGADLRIVRGSLLDPSKLTESMADREVVFHLAAIPSVARSVAMPRQSNDANAAGTIELMLAAAQAGVQRVILAASSSVYGAPEALPCSEEVIPDPKSPYAASKLAAEGYLHSLGTLHGIQTVALRYFNVFGPGQDPLSQYAAVVPRFITTLLAGEPPTINGDGSASRDFTYVENVVHANLRASEATLNAPLTCNIGCGGRHSLLNLLDAIARAANRSVTPTFGPARPGDVLHSQADIRRAQERLGYEVRVPFAEGIERTVAWYRDPRTASSSGT